MRISGCLARFDIPSTWFIVVLNTGLRPYLVVSEIIAIAEPWVSVGLRKCSLEAWECLSYRVIANKTIGFAL